MFKIEKYSESFISPRYREIVRQFCGTKEGGASHYGPKGKRVKEQLVKCIWSGRFIKKKLYTEDGSRIEIISPGSWNVEEGPDFKGVEFLLEGKGVIKGDVEIHVYAQDWVRHGHHKQKEYEDVRLHVFMWNDNKNKYIKLKNHLVPQLELCKFLEFKLDKLAEMIDVEEYPHPAGANAGPCQKGLRAISSDDKWIGHFLDFAGDERILVKTSRFEKRLNTQTFEQVLYEAIMESLGYKNNKEQFLRLSSIVSINDIKTLIPIDGPAKQKSKMLQALFFGMSGLLSDQTSSSKTMDKQSLEYIKEINGMWSEMKDVIKSKPMNGGLWCFKYSRPGNFPTRRIAAISRLLAENLETGIFRMVLKSFESVDINVNETKQVKAVIKNTESFFLELYDDFWSYYYTFGGKRLKSRERLIGKERLSVIFVNIIIPVLLAYARKTEDLVLEEKLFKVYKLHQKLSHNNVTKFMSCRIFGLDIQKSKIVDTARRQQGLLQIFKDFCESEDIACKKCALLLSINSALSTN